MAGTQSCQAAHPGYLVSGPMHLAAAAEHLISTRTGSRFREFA